MATGTKQLPHKQRKKIVRIKAQSLSLLGEFQFDLADEDNVSWGLLGGRGLNQPSPWAVSEGQSQSQQL